jgi:phage shock protein PspC (stress-responsive transcriptional regulator)
MTNPTTPPTRRTTKLYKDPIDKKIGGVASGVAKYFDVDTTLVRVIWVVSAILGGFGLILYVALWFILDDDPEAFAEPIEPTPVDPVMVEAPVEEEAALETAQDEIETETAETGIDQPVAEG